MTRRGTCRSCRKRRLLDQNSHLCGICHISQASIWQVARQSQTPPPGQLTHVGARSMERVQLYSDFVRETHSTVSMEEKKRVMTISYLTNLQETEILSPMLTTAIDALSWAHAGSVHQDKRLTHASHDAYGRVLTTLRGVIESPTRAGKPAHWEVLATVMLMSIVDTTLTQQGASPGGQSAWMTHFWGAQQYLSTIGATGLDLDHVVSKVMTFSIYQSVILIGIARRKTIDLQAPQKAAASQPDDRSKPWAVVQMQHRFLTFQPVAGLLEETDTLLEDRATDITTELHALWQKLEQARTNVAQCVCEARDHTITITASDAAFDYSIEEHRVISATPVFPTLFSFDILDAGVYFACTVMILLIVDCTLLRLLHFKPAVATSAISRDEDEIERDALDLAKKLCQCIHYFSKLDSLAYAHFTVLLLEFAQNVFRTQSAQKELEWCRACLVAVQARIQRIGSTRRPTLCRIGDLPPGIPRAGLYRSIWREEGSPSPRFGCPMKALPAPPTPISMMDELPD